MFLEASFLKVKYARTHTLKTLASSTAVKRWIWAVHPPYIFLMACLHTHRADAALALQLVATSSHTTSHFLVSPRNCQKGLSPSGGVWEFFFFSSLAYPLNAQALQGEGEAEDREKGEEVGCGLIELVLGWVSVLPMAWQLW